MVLARMLILSGRKRATSFLSPAELLHKGRDLFALCLGILFRLGSFGVDVLFFIIVHVLPHPTFRHSVVTVAEGPLVPLRCPGQLLVHVSAHKLGGCRLLRGSKGCRIRLLLDAVERRVIKGRIERGEAVIRNGSVVGGGSERIPVAGQAIIAAGSGSSDSGGRVTERAVLHGWILV